MDDVCLDGAPRETTRLRVRRSAIDTLRPGGRPLRELVIHPGGRVEAYYQDEAAAVAYPTLLALLKEHSLHAHDLEIVVGADDR